MKQAEIIQRGERLRSVIRHSIIWMWGALGIWAIMFAVSPAPLPYLVVMSVIGLSWSALVVFNRCNSVLIDAGAFVVVIYVLPRMISWGFGVTEHTHRLQALFLGLFFAGLAFAAMKERFIRIAGLGEDNGGLTSHG